VNIDVMNIRNEKVGEVTVPDEIFSAPVSGPLLNQAVKVYLARQRQGTASTKTRAEVSGSGRKLWKQKHTGRARVGSIRTPLWRHGGTVFGPRPHTYKLALPKKMRQLALRSAVAVKFQEGKFLVIDDLTLADAKTKTAVAAFKALGVTSALVLENAENGLLRRAIRNLPRFQFASNPVLPVYHILKHDQLVVTVRTLGLLLEALQ